MAIGKGTNEAVSESLEGNAGMSQGDLLLGLGSLTQHWVLNEREGLGGTGLDVLDNEDCWMMVRHGRY